MKNKYLIILMLCSLFVATIPVNAQSENWTIEGDTVYVDDSNVYIGVTPHTIQGSGYVNLEILSKHFSGEIDVCFGFDVPTVSPKSLELYNPHPVLHSKDLSPYWNNPEFDIQYTSNYVEVYYNYTLYDVDTVTVTGWEWLLIYEHSYEYNEGTTIFWHETEDYINLAKKLDFTKSLWDYGGMNTWFFTTANVNEGVTYQLRLLLDVLPVLNGDTLKYWVAFKPHEESLSEARDNGHFYCLDPWLDPAWDYRTLLTIESDLVDEPLTDFPVLIHLSNDTSGISNDDVSFIFDEVGAEDLKIAFTSSDGETELYAEIEYWDATLEIADIWVKVPSISNETDTDIYMYYDSDQDDNSAYVGVTNSAVAENVWDVNFIFVHHMADGADNAHTYDSTQYDYDGTKTGANDPIQRSGMVAGYSQNFDGGNSGVGLGLVPYDETTNAITLEAWVILDDLSFSDCIIGGTGGYTGATLGFADDSVLEGGLRVGNGAAYSDAYHTTNMAIDDTTMYYFAGTYDYVGDQYIRSYTNGTENDNTAYSSDPVWGNGVKNRYIGANAVGAGNPDAHIDEARASNVSRSASWIAVTYQTCLDTLIEFNAQQGRTVSTTVCHSTTVTSCFFTTISTTSCDSFWSTVYTTTSMLNTSTTTLHGTTTDDTVISIDRTITVDYNVTESVDETYISASTVTTYYTTCLTTNATEYTTVTATSCDSYYSSVTATTTYNSSIVSSTIVSTDTVSTTIENIYNTYTFNQTFCESVAVTEIVASTLTTCITVGSTETLVTTLSSLTTYDEYKIEASSITSASTLSNSTTTGSIITQTTTCGTHPPSVYITIAQTVTYVENISQEVTYYLEDPWMMQVILVVVLIVGIGIGLYYGLGKK